MSRELLGSPSASPILKSTPSPPISNPVSKSIESVLRNTVSLPATTQNTPEMAHYYAATRFKKIKSSSNKPVLIKYESKESDISKSTSPIPCLYFPPPPPKNTPEKEKLLPHYLVVTPTCSNPPESDVAVIASPKSTVSSLSSFSIVNTQHTGQN